MCLSVNEKSVKVKARIDKVCYKHLIVIDEKLLTPYRHSNIEIGKTYKSKLIKTGERYFSVELGLHSFKEVNACIHDAKAEFRIDRNYYKTKYSNYHHVIVKCIIPKGSRYYVGRFDGSLSYASDTIKYLEIMQNISSNY